MKLCACGCGQEIIWKPSHRTRNVQYIRGHFHRGKRYCSHRIPIGGTYCACGCGTFISEFKPCGHPRYSRSKEGIFYISGHNPQPQAEASPKWKGGSHKQHGYAMIYQPSHPRATGGYVREHILVWESAHGQMAPNEEIHHINGVRDDNRIQNLIALTKRKHHKFHYAEQGGIPSTTEQKQEAGRKGAKARWSSH